MNGQLTDFPDSPDLLDLLDRLDFDLVSGKYWKPKDERRLLNLSKQLPLVCRFQYQNVHSLDNVVSSKAAAPDSYIFVTQSCKGHHIGFQSIIPLFQKDSVINRIVDCDRCCVIIDEFPRTRNRS